MMFNEVLGLGTLAMQIAAAAVLLAYLFRKKSSLATDVVKLAATYALPIAFLSTAFATGFSLYHSDVIGIVPCGLCWLQRIFIYSQALIFLIAWIRKDYGVWIYGIALSAVGAVIAFYQHLLQMGVSGGLPCPAAPGAGDCAQRFLFELGYITYPLMAFSLLVFVIVLMLALRERTKQQ